MTVRDFKEYLQSYQKYGDMVFQIRTDDDDEIVSEMICDVLNRELWL